MWINIFSNKYKREIYIHVNRLQQHQFYLSPKAVLLKLPGLLHFPEVGYGCPFSISFRSLAVRSGSVAAMFVVSYGSFEWS
jgi:hypothetical protein